MSNLANQIEVTTTALLEKYKADMLQAEQLVQNLISNKDSFLVSGLLYTHRNIRWAIEKGNAVAALAEIKELILDQAWKAYFDEADFFHMVANDVYYAAIVPYVFSNTESQSYYRGVDKLADFTRENIEAFNKKHLSVNADKLKTALKGILGSTGRDYKTRNSEFKTRQALSMTVVGGAQQPSIHFEAIEKLGCFAQAVEYFCENKTPTKLNDLQEMLKGFNEFDTEKKLIEGVSLILKPSLSTELRLSKEVVSRLNAALAETV